jgi:hypothetical protein
VILTTAGPHVNLSESPPASVGGCSGKSDLNLLGDDYAYSIS